MGLLLHEAFNWWAKFRSKSLVFCWHFEVSQRLSGGETSPVLYLAHFYSFQPTTQPLLLFLTWFKELPRAALWGRLKIWIYWLLYSMGNIWFLLCSWALVGFAVPFRGQSHSTLQVEFGFKAELLPSAICFSILKMGCMMPPSMFVVKFKWDNMCKALTLSLVCRSRGS